MANILITPIIITSEQLRLRTQPQAFSILIVGRLLRLGFLPLAIALVGSRDASIELPSLAHNGASDKLNC